MIAGFVIWSICTVLFAGIGIYCRMTKNAVGFFTFAEAQKVKDVKGYNKAVSALWLVFAVIWELIGIPFLNAKQNSLIFIFIALGAFVWVIAMIAIYIKIELKYSKK